MSNFLTIEDFAALVGKNPRTIYNILTAKKPSSNKAKSELPPFIRVASKFVLTQKAFQEWLDSRPAANAPVVPAKRRPGRPRKNAQGVA